MGALYRFIRCPCCGKWATIEAFKKGATGGYELETGQSPGGGGKWLKAPLSMPMRHMLARLLRTTAELLEQP